MQEHCTSFADGNIAGFRPVSSYMVLPKNLTGEFESLIEQLGLSQGLFWFLSIKWRIFIKNHTWSKI